MSRTRKLVFAGATLAAFAIAAWIFNTTVWRDAEYWKLIEGYKAARVLPKRPDAQDPRNVKRWEEQIALPNGISVTLVALEGFTSSTVRYSDEQTPRDIYRYVDYTVPTDVRIRGGQLYILRGIALLTREMRLLLYDLTRRELVVDRRVDDRDLR